MGIGGVKPVEARTEGGVSRRTVVNVEKVRCKYRRNAWFYDRVVRMPTERLRCEAVGRLALHPGDRVLDLGCGTGLSLAFLREAVGDSGVVYGVELSPDMLALAGDKVEAAGWKNVRLAEADAETFELDEYVDGILCFYTHDIMVSPTALPGALRYLRPGGRVVAAGAKLVRGWRGWLINPLTVAYSLPFVTTRDRTSDPLAIMRESVADCRVEERLLGSRYLAWGVHRVRR